MLSVALTSQERDKQSLERATYSRLRFSLGLLCFHRLALW